MPEVPLLHRVPPWTIAAVLAVALLATLVIASALGRYFAKGVRADEGSLVETMVSGLLGLLLAFNFSIAQDRFEARQAEIVREANAIGTAYLRCSVLDAEDARRSCQRWLHDYALLRRQGYDAYGRFDVDSMRHALDEGTKRQHELWGLAARAARVSPTPTKALLLSALNDVIDRDTDRRESLRILVPQAVTVAIMLSCVIWAFLLGYSSGLRLRPWQSRWAVAALLIALVFGVALDLDRPRAGLITTTWAERSMRDVVQATEAPSED